MRLLCCQRSFLLLGLAILALPAMAETPAELALRLAQLGKSSQNWAKVDAELTTETRHKLLGVLKDGDDKAKEAAATLLAHTGEPLAAPQVITHYAYRLPVPKNNILPGVVNFGLAAAEPIAAILLTHPSIRMQQAAWHAFTQLHGVGDKQLELPITDSDYQKALLMVMFKAQHEGTRLGAINLSKTVLPEDIRRDAFVILAKDPSAVVAQVVSITKKIDTIVKPKEADMPRATPEQIVAGSRSPSWLRRYQVAGLAATTWNADVRDAMLALLLDPDTRVRDAAAVVLYLNMGKDEAIVTRVKEMLRDKDAAKQIAATAVLNNRYPRDGRVPGKHPGLAEAIASFWPMARQLAFSPNQDVRMAILRAMLVSRGAAEESVLYHMRADRSRAIVHEIQNH